MLQHQFQKRLRISGGMKFMGIIVFITLMTIFSPDIMNADTGKTGNSFAMSGQRKSAGATSQTVGVSKEAYGWSSLKITSVTPDTAYAQEQVTVRGYGFGSAAGYICVSGLQIRAQSWTNTCIQFVVPDQAASGEVYVRDAKNVKSNAVGFAVKRDFPAGQFEPAGLDLVDTGLLGASFLVETDGQFLYGILGFETLSTYRIFEDKPYELCSRFYLPQRVGDLRVHNGYLYCSGDHGLYIFKCQDLQNGVLKSVVSISGGCFMAVDIKEKTGAPLNGTLVVLAEYKPNQDSDSIRILLFGFQNQELIPVGMFSRIVDASTERQHAIAVDPENAKVYVSGYLSFLGNNGYILEIDITNPEQCFINYREETGVILAFDMESTGDRLWIGASVSGNTLFQAYKLLSGSGHFYLDESVKGKLCLGRATRIKIIDESVTAGSAWVGERPDVFLMNTFENGSSVKASENSVDWAFDVTGFASQAPDYDGKIIIADEWGGFLTYEYKGAPENTITHVKDCHQVMGAAMTEGLHLTDKRIYIAGRGAGPWSADRHDLSNESEWRSVAWDWNLADPQPYPVSSVCTKQDPVHGTLIAALGHEKAMSWGYLSYGILYRETAANIEQIAMSEVIDPPGLFYSTGIDIVWAEDDLVFAATGTDGFRAFVVNPDAPSITIHKDCAEAGFGRDVYSTTNEALCMRCYTQGNVRKLIIGSVPELFEGTTTLNVFSITYPEGIPDRNHPDRSILVQNESGLKCFKYKTVNHIDMSHQGLVSVSTPQGIALFHISWIPTLNNMTNAKAWSHILVPVTSYEPWWESTWTNSFKDASLDGETTYFAVKTPEGVWKVDFVIDWQNYTHDCTSSGYYPGIECGMDYNNMHAGWANPDIPTLHHPYAVVASNGSAYITGWSGKVQRVASQN